MVEKKSYEDGHCPVCASERADIKATHEVEYRSNQYSSLNNYYILECRGCGGNYFKHKSSNSEDYHDYYDENTGEHEVEYIETIQFWPPPARRHRPDWFTSILLEDRVLGSLFENVYTALDNNLSVLAAIGMRTVFDRASELLGVETQKHFDEKLIDLETGKHITEKEVSVLRALIDAGSAAAHRGWKPKVNQLDDMMNILESFLHRAFLLESIGKKLGKHVPVRESKKK